MKNNHTIFILLLTTIMYGCRGNEYVNPDMQLNRLSDEISATGNFESIGSEKSAMTKALIGTETVGALEGNFIYLSEPKQPWTEESQYVRVVDMPSFSEAKIVEGEIISSPDNSGARLRSIVFSPKITYEYYARNSGSVEPDIAYITRMVGWYPSTFDVPPGVDGKNSIAWFRDSGCMVELPDGQIGVRFDNKLDGQTDLMVTDMREGRIYKEGFKHDESSNDYDVQPFGHAYNDPLNLEDYRYINYFTFHHYLTAVRIHVQKEADSKGDIGMINNIKFLNQPASVTVTLPSEQNRSRSASPKVPETTPTLPIEGVLPIFGDVVDGSWGDFRDLDIIRTPMSADPSDVRVSELPVIVPSTEAMAKTYLGYALLRPWGGEGDEFVTKIQMYTDAGVYSITLPNKLSEASGDLPVGTELLQPGKIYDITITIKGTGGLEVVISNEDDEKYRDLTPYNENYEGYEYSNCYLVTEDMLKDGYYDGFYFRAEVPGRGKNGDVMNDPYPADYELDPHSVSLLWQDSNLPVSHVELVQGAVRFKLCSPFTPGNAIIAAHDSSGDIIWSWHIWLTSYIGEDVENIMDRNLGALFGGTPTNEDEALASYGLYYQWGRKDPSPGPMSYNYNIFDMRTSTYYTVDGMRNDVGEVYMAGAAPKIENSVQNPTVILAPSDLSPVYIYDWLWDTNDDLWGGVSEKKTIYDPCPYGYKVPTDEINNFLASVSSVSGTYGLTYRGLFFPSAGWKGDDVNSATRSHAWMGVGKGGDYQNASVESTTNNRGRYFFVTSEFYAPSTKKTYNQGTHNTTGTSRTIAAPVRCVKYDESSDR